MNKKQKARVDELDNRVNGEGRIRLREESRVHLTLMMLLLGQVRLKGGYPVSAAELAAMGRDISDLMIATGGIAYATQFEEVKITAKYVREMAKHWCFEDMVK